MSTTATSLWPTLEEIGTAGYLAPVAIMREQAELIGKMTNNILEGQVVSEKVTLTTAYDIMRASSRGVGQALSRVAPGTVDNGKIRYAFLLRAPALDSTTVRFFDVTHDLASTYPVTFRSALQASQEDIFSHKKESDAASEEDFREMLRSFFHSDTVIRILQSLISQSSDFNTGAEN